MSHPVIIRRHDGVQSYLVLDDYPRELLRHRGFQAEFEIRRWYGSTDVWDALEQWAEMMGESPLDDIYLIITDEHLDYTTDKSLWDECSWPY
ncbi:MAG: hypothetical protein JRI57_06065 [Deltaproteobacteria bacterium]|nr:hypothetical protein [Deltaproteobacteria bacterium]MBW1952321.1 hypothetical protein [Deltaproteobacteria bacterium]MBW1986512.1 hypothetical protein [Deltaproteobacteria bacterium]MBW2135091.1 hypothetical protein [Deltaproteobacteria bacterium]